MNLSFAGCGFMGFYHVGVAACIRSYLPNLCFNRISGASAGGIAAACLLTDAPLGEITSLILEIATQARSRFSGPFSPCFDIQTLLRDGLSRTLPDDAHLRVNGRINISVTCAYTRENVVLTHFSSKDELIQALLCSSFIPGFSGLVPPKFRGGRYMDGGFTKNLLILDENTVTVSPFCGNSHICPQDSSDPIKNFLQFQFVYAETSIELSLANVIRLFHIMIPPDTETLSKICQQGFDDTKRFLERNSLIGCDPCVFSRWSKKLDALKDDCKNCEVLKRVKSEAYLPEPVSEIIQRAIEAGNKELMTRVFRNPAVKLISLISTPYILPADVLLAIIIKILRWSRNSIQSKHVFSSKTRVQEMALTTIVMKEKTGNVHSPNPTASQVQLPGKVSVTFGINLRIEKTYEVFWTSYCKDSLEEIVAHNEHYEDLVVRNYS